MCLGEIDFYIYCLTTFPFIVRTCVFGIVLAINVTVFVCNPSLPSLLNVTLMIPDSPGLTGSFGNSGTVHPQLPLAERITRSPLPVFLNLKANDTLSP